MSKIIGFIVTAGHLDIEWYQPLRSYRFWTTEALEDLKTIHRTREDFVTYCLDGQFYPLKEHLSVVPEDEEEMREMIRKNILAIGPFYTQFDEWLPSAESMIRNCLYGDRLCKSFGGYMRAGYLPDNFGHPLQMPQILKNFDIDSLLFMRGMPEIPGGHDDEFLYTGIDGSEIFVSHFRESYSGAFDIFRKNVLPSQPRTVPYYEDYLSFEYQRSLAVHDDPVRIATGMIADVHRIKDRYPTKVIPLIAGHDHMPPQINVGDTVKVANEMQDEIEFVMGDVEEYVRLATSRLDENGPCQQYSMELIGSKYMYILLGALSTRSYLKRENFACEALIEKYAEPLDALASLYSYPHKPRLLDEAWDCLMVNSAHDSIHGSSVDEVHLEMQTRFANVRQIAAGVIHDSLRHIGKYMSPWGEEQEELLALSPTTGKHQTVELWLPVNLLTPGKCEWLSSHAPTADFPRKEIAIVDENGRQLPTQVVDRDPIPANGNGDPRHEMYPASVFEKVLFSDDFAAFQPQKYRMVAIDTPMTSTLQAGDTYIENELIRVESHGALLKLTDKRSGFTVQSLNLLEEDADAGDAWDYAPTWIPGEVVRSTRFSFESRLKESGPVRAVLEITGMMNVPAKLEGDNRSLHRVDIPVTFTVTVHTGSPRVDVKLVLDNTARDHRIRLRIPSPVVTDFVRSQGHLAILDRPVEPAREIEPWLQPPTRLMPCREWIALQDETHGLAIALKGMYDYETVVDPLTRRPDLCVTLLRGIGLMGRINTLQRKGSASMSIPTPGAQCLGEQVMEWAYVPYAADKEEKAPFLADVQSFLYPPVGHAIRSSHETAAPASTLAFRNKSAAIDEVFTATTAAIYNPHTTTDGEIAPYTLEEKYSNIQFSAFKKCYDNDGYILRFFENQGKKTTVTLRLSDVFTRAYLANMNEKVLAKLPIVDGMVTLEFGSYKAVTVKLIQEMDIREEPLNSAR